MLDQIVKWSAVSTTSKNGLPPSPAELMMGRRLRNKLLVHPEKLIIYPTKNQFRKNQQKLKMYADKLTKHLSDLQTGDNVWFQLKKKSSWIKDVIISLTNSRRMMNVSMSEIEFPFVVIYKQLPQE